MISFWHLTPTQTQPGRGGSVEEVHLPTPLAFAPWGSRHLVGCFHAPHRLPAWLMHIYYSTCDCANIRKINLGQILYVGPQHGIGFDTVCNRWGFRGKVDSQR